MAKSKKYYLFNKPRGVLSQFTKEHGKKALSDFGPFPGDVYPVGRLDEKSEGLLLLTNDKAVNEQLLHPEHQHKRVYLAQLDGQITKKAVKELASGITINLPGGDYKTLSCEVKKIGLSSFPPADFRIDFSKKRGTSAVQITLTEGKNRQVRRMCAAAGFPVVRLVRSQIENIHLAQLQSGESKQINRPLFYKGLRLG